MHATLSIIQSPNLPIEAKETGEPTVAQRRWHAGSLTYTGAGLTGLFFWLLWGDFAFTLQERAVPPTMQLLLRQFHISNFVVGIVLITLPGVVGFFIGPVIAFRSDRHRSQRGRRIPFLVVPVPLTFVSMAGLAFSPALGVAADRWLGRWSPGSNDCVIALLAVSWVLFSVSAGVCNGVYLSLITDVVPREVIGRFFALFRIVGLVAAIIFNYYIFSHVEQHFVVMFLGVGTIYLISFVAMSRKVKEGSYPSSPAAGDSGTGFGTLPRRFVAGAKVYCRDCFAIPYYRWVFLSMALGYIGSVPINIFYVFYAKSFEMSTATLGRLLSIQLFLSLLQAYPIGWLADRFHPLRLTLIALVPVGGASLAAFFLVHDARSLGVALVVCGTLVGSWATAFASIPVLLFPRQKFAIFNNSLQTIMGIGTMLAGPAAGWILDRMHNDYRYLYLWSAVFAVLSFLITLVVYQKFVRFGGPTHYSAPE